MKITSLGLLLLAPFNAMAQPHFNGAKALEYARQFVAIGPRWPTSPGHAKAEAFLRDHFKHDQLEEDTFTANTPIGSVPMRNFIVRYPGKKDGVIVLATHYETNYPLRNINFVVEEAINAWSDSDSTYGTKHLAARWGRDGTLTRLKAFILTDMIGDKDLEIQRESCDAAWLVDLVQQAAKKYGDEKYFFKQEMEVEDDHLPFVKRGVPSIDIIDLNYGHNNSYHHTDKDTMDKLSAHSLTIDGDVIEETIRLINQR